MLLSKGTAPFACEMSADDNPPKALSAVEAVFCPVPPASIASGLATTSGYCC